MPGIPTLSLPKGPLSHDTHPLLLRPSFRSNHPNIHSQVGFLLGFYVGFLYMQVTFKFNIVGFLCNMMHFSRRNIYTCMGT